MKKITTPVLLTETTYQLTDIDELANLLFFDIETTGFSAKKSSLYMIGLLYFENDKLMATQLFAETPDEEVFILKEFLEICQNYQTTIHYNGNTFDIPYIREKCRQHQLKDPFETLKGIDLYKRFSVFKNILHLENCKQKTVETFVGIEREDLYNGGELIEFYKKYTVNKAQEISDLLFLHNFDDLKGMYQLLPILTYMDLLLVPFRVVKVHSNGYYDLDEKERFEVVMKLRFHSYFPKPISINKNGCRFSGSGNEGFLKVPLLKEPLKYFYSNYTDYYYLPKEDVALHKSVASFVDKEHRQQANARNCYTRKEGAFLPEWDFVFTPVFKKEFDDNVCYFELTNEMKKQPEEFRKYALHLLDMLINAKEDCPRE